MADQPATVITVVHAPACHFCDDARDALTDLGRDYRFSIHLVDAESEHGRMLTARHRAGMFPLVLVDDQFFSVGRLPRKKLRKLLDSPAPAAVT